MSHPAVHGAGPLTMIFGVAMIFIGFAFWARMSTPAATNPDSKFPRVAAFNKRASRWSKWFAVAGIPVAITGLIIWAAS